MNYNIPPIAYIRSFYPVSWTLERNLHDMCLALAPDFNSDAQQIIIAAKVLLLPLDRVRRLAASDFACLDILMWWKNALVNALKPEYLYIKHYANFVRFELRKFAEFVESSRSLILQTINYVPAIATVEIRAPVMPCFAFDPLADAKPEYFYYERRQALVLYQQQSAEAARYNETFSQQKMTFEDKFAYFLYRETQEAKDRVRLEYERAANEQYFLYLEDQASVELSLRYREYLKKRAEEQEIYRLVAERLHKLQLDITQSARNLQVKKK